MGAKPVLSIGARDVLSLIRKRAEAPPPAHPPPARRDSDLELLISIGREILVMTGHQGLSGLLERHTRANVNEAQAGVIVARISQRIAQRKG
jgi:hypothetical protein